MSEMFYEEENFKRPARAVRGKSKMVQWLMDKGIAKSESVASIILIGIAVIALALTFWIIKGDDLKRSFQNNQAPTDQQLNFQERRAERLNR